MKNLNANGANIPAIGMGTWQLKGDECAQIVRQALEAGYRNIDTAIMYENETAVGEGLKAAAKLREDYLVTTKVWPTDVRDGTFQKAVEGSLKRLDCGAVDLLLIHWPPKTEGPEEWAKLLDWAVDEGMTRHVGVSNFTSHQLKAIVQACNHPIACNQVENHPYLDQTILQQACRSLGVALIAYCPLYRGGPLFEEMAVTDAARAHGKSAAQVVLRWHVQHDGAGAIPKTATPARLHENIDIFDFELSPAEMAAISALGMANERICDFEFSPDWD